MAKYTMTIREILQRANNSVDVIEPAEMTELSKRYLFGSELNYISEEYRDFLATAFAYHYFNDEIGYETYGMWRQRVMGVVYENQYYLNDILKNHLKGIFAEYSVQHSEGKKDETGNLVTSINREVNDENDSTSEADGRQNSQSEGTGLRTDNLRDTTNYNSATADRGTVNNQDSGSDVRRNTGTTEQAHTGYDTAYSQGYSSESHTGYDENTDERTDTNKRNAVQLFSDTPMGDLDNLITAVQGDATGTGVARATTPGTQYNYLSTATENDATDVDQSNGSARTDYNSQNRTENNLEDRDVYNSQQTQTDNTAETTTYGRGQSETRNLTSSRSGSDTDVHTGTVQNNETSNASGTEHSEGKGHSEGHRTEDTTMNNDRTHNQTSEGDVEKTRITYDLLLRSANLLSKVWDIFDPLFMGIF